MEEKLFVINKTDPISKMDNLKKLVKDSEYPYVTLTNESSEPEHDRHYR